MRDPFAAKSRLTVAAVSLLRAEIMLCSYSVNAAMQISDERYRVFYGPLALGEFDETDCLFYPRRAWDT